MSKLNFVEMPENNIVIDIDIPDAAAITNHNTSALRAAEHYGTSILQTRGYVTLDELMEHII